MPFKIMAVDDEPEILAVIRDMLQSAECDVVAVTDSRDAARRLESERFDAIFLDAVMPEVDGFELARRTRASPLNRKLPIVMLTAYDDADTMRKAFNAGVSLFLGKPVSRSRLKALFSLVTGSMECERRRRRRLPFRAPLRCQSGRGRFLAESLNIGEDGLLMKTSRSLRPGEELQVEFDMPSLREPLRVRAKVHRKEAARRIAVEFLGLLEPYRWAIREYIGEPQPT
jgi:CheY-like chemotaxis protein